MEKDIHGFPWVEKVRKKILRNFPKEDESSLCLLQKHVHEETKQIINQADKVRAESLFETLNSFYLFFIHWGIYWHKESLAKIVCVKILCCMVDIGLLLSGGDAQSQWIEKILLVTSFPGDSFLMYDVLLLTRDVKPYQEAFEAIIKFTLTEHMKNPPDAESYVKTLLLYRRLKLIQKTPAKDNMIYSLAVKVKCPPDFLSWIRFNEVDLLDCKQSDRVKILLEHGNKTPLRKLYKVLFEHKYPEFEAELQERKLVAITINNKIKTDKKNISKSRKNKNKHDFETKQTSIMKVEERDPDSTEFSNPYLHVASEGEANATFSQSNSWGMYHCLGHSEADAEGKSATPGCLSCQVTRIPGRLPNAVSHSCVINVPARVGCPAPEHSVIRNQSRISTVDCLKCGHNQMSSGSCCNVNYSIDGRNLCCRITHQNNMVTYSSQSDVSGYTNPSNIPTNVHHRNQLTNSFPRIRTVSPGYGHFFNDGHTNIVKPFCLHPKSGENLSFMKQAVVMAEPSPALQRSHTPLDAPLNGDEHFIKKPDEYFVPTHERIPLEETNAIFSACPLSETSSTSAFNNYVSAPLDLSTHAVRDNFFPNSLLPASEISLHDSQNLNSSYDVPFNEKFSELNIDVDLFSKINDSVISELNVDLDLSSKNNDLAINSKDLSSPETLDINVSDCFKTSGCIAQDLPNGPQAVYSSSNLSESSFERSKGKLPETNSTISCIGDSNLKISENDDSTVKPQETRRKLSPKSNLKSPVKSPSKTCSLKQNSKSKLKSTENPVKAIVKPVRTCKEIRKRRIKSKRFISDTDSSSDSSSKTSRKGEGKQQKTVHKPKQKHLTISSDSSVLNLDDPEIRIEADSQTLNTNSLVITEKTENIAKSFSHSGEMLNGYNSSVEIFGEHDENYVNMVCDLKSNFPTVSSDSFNNIIDCITELDANPDAFDPDSFVLGEETVSNTASFSHSDEMHYGTDNLQQSEAQLKSFHNVFVSPAKLLSSFKADDSAASGPENTQTQHNAPDVIEPQKNVNDYNYGHWMVVLSPLSQKLYATVSSVNLSETQIMEGKEATLSLDECDLSIEHSSSNAVTSHVKTKPENRRRGTRKKPSQSNCKTARKNGLENSRKVLKETVSVTGSNVEILTQDDLCPLEKTGNSVNLPRDFKPCKAASPEKDHLACSDSEFHSLNSDSEPESLKEKSSEMIQGTSKLASGSGRSSDDKPVVELKKRLRPRK